MDPKPKVDLILIYHCDIKFLFPFLCPDQVFDGPIINNQLFQRYVSFCL